MSEGPSNGPGGHQAQGQGGQGQGPSASAAASAASGQGGQGPSEDFRDLGPEAAWSLSSAKQGNGDQAKMLGSEIAGVEQLRDGSTDTFWQSVQVVELKEPDGATLRKGGNEVPVEAGSRYLSPSRAFDLWLAVLTNHQNGRDTHIRQIKVLAPAVRRAPVRMCLGRCVLSNFRPVSCSSSRAFGEGNRPTTVHSCRETRTLVWTCVIYPLWAECPMLTRMVVAGLPAMSFAVPMIASASDTSAWLMVGLFDCSIVPVPVNSLQLNVPHKGAMSGPGPTSKVTHGLPTWTPIDRTGDNERHQLRVMPTAATPRRVETVNLVLERKYLFRGTSPDRKSGKDVNAIFRKFKEIGREVLPTDFNQNFLFFGTLPSVQSKVVLVQEDFWRAVEFWLASEGVNLPREVRGSRLMQQMKERAAKIVNHLSVADVACEDGVSIIRRETEKDVDRKRHKLMTLSRYAGEPDLPDEEEFVVQKNTWKDPRVRGDDSSEGSDGSSIDEGPSQGDPRRTPRKVPTSKRVTELKRCGSTSFQKGTNGDRTRACMKEQQKTEPCFLCQKLGHWSQECPLRKKGGQRPSSSHQVHVTAGPYKSDQGQWELLQSIVGYMPECSSERETAPHSCLVTMASESVMAEHEVFWSLREWRSSLILDLGCMKSVAGTRWVNQHIRRLKSLGRWMKARSWTDMIEESPTLWAPGRPLRTAKKGCETPDGGCQIEVGGTREVQVCRGVRPRRRRRTPGSPERNSRLEGDKGMLGDPPCGGAGARMEAIPDVADIELDKPILDGEDDFEEENDETIDVDALKDAEEEIEPGTSTRRTATPRNPKSSSSPSATTAATATTTRK
ncbi:Anaphase-promoting complex subunit 10 [Symbiodinium microadriaticum]|uniref:Anaphase-promoting complex subunit 10 n=1 Tax=Symbiodinium microadriaticum TaxID=2951 RepID=A0A1Q9DXG7_SYMMI|nr:Anaphase-promoting complex subunit 10 [Symbiodinium microadriaticum]